MISLMSSFCKLWIFTPSGVITRVFSLWRIIFGIWGDLRSDSSCNAFLSHSKQEKYSAFFAIFTATDSSLNVPSYTTLVLPIPIHLTNLTILVLNFNDGLTYPNKFGKLSMIVTRYFHPLFSPSFANAKYSELMWLYVYLVNISEFIALSILYTINISIIIQSVNTTYTNSHFGWSWSIFSPKDIACPICVLLNLPPTRNFILPTTTTLNRSTVEPFWIKIKSDFWVPSDGEACVSLIISLLFIAPNFSSAWHSDIKYSCIWLSRISLSPLGGLKTFQDFSLWKKRSILMES